MWLTGMAQPGNGHRAAFLDHACTQIIALCREVRVELASVLVRADGEFGSLAQIAQIAGHGLGWLVRAKDYVTLLRHQDVRAVLGRGSGLRMAQPDSPIVRELFDVPDLMWRSVDGRREVRTRLVVTRTPWSADLGKPGVGHLHEDFVYELVVTNLPPEAASAAEVVSLYLGRGALEATLAQEDREMSTDRWITHRAPGQDLFQIISQWVWNHRIVLGAAMMSKSALRVTPWEVSVTKTEPAPIPSLPDGKSASSEAPDEKSASSDPPDRAVAPVQTDPGPSTPRASAPRASRAMTRARCTARADIECSSRRSVIAAAASVIATVPRVRPAPPARWCRAAAGAPDRRCKAASWICLWQGLLRRRPHRRLCASPPWMRRPLPSRRLALRVVCRCW
jgi:hypothetical protein